MCGITGFCSFNNSILDPQKTLKDMTDVISHRGPDDEGYMIANTDNAVVGLGHRRLSIIDLSSSGHQPMTDESKDLNIVFNGEIYNYKEVRQELLNLGYTFKSSSDTEVILNAFRHWGESCAEHFIGMFAFAIFDKTKNKLFLCRDRLGVKPLYYYENDNILMFASELKSFHKNAQFHKEINQESLSNYLQTGYVTPHKSIYKNVKKLKPGHWLIYDVSSKTNSLRPFWQLKDVRALSSFNSIGEIIETLEPIMKSAFNYRMVSDVPVGVFLSGGVDSSLLTAILSQNKDRELTTFTIGFNEKKYDEAKYAREVSQYFNTNHIEEYCSVKDAYNVFPDLVYIYDEPFGDNSALPMIMLSRIASNHLKVVLSADGGDELFAGYPSYKLVNSYLKHAFKVPGRLRPTVAKYFRRLISGYRNNKTASMLIVVLNILESKQYLKMSDAINGPFSSMEINPLLKINWTKEDTSKFINYTDDFVRELQLIDIENYLLEDILVKVDRATMSTSIESREPFLDHRLVEIAQQIPSKLNIYRKNQKWILKEILRKYMPQYQFNRPKRGFDVPIGQWMRKELKEYYDYYLSEDKIKTSSVFNFDEIKVYKDLLENNKNIRGLHRKLWFILVYQAWQEKWEIN
ncbi:asparagine synthase (glutamine-hydrolyzing) [Winogradskyella sp.]|uniref:asparagine synthase (glutamine-hydrolyzing) n=1 Tax=Winogradskyella sp. TaxID=1883156 RepID=UPI0026198F72|nr:asparagine synthase (glutamine-hydrolyzing) [Winogradskyella sp.]